MSGKTHAVIGANAVWIVYLFGAPDASSVFLIVAGAFAALLPDIDATGATIHFMFKGALGMFRNVFKHRSFFHSIFAVLGIYLMSLVAFWRINPILPLVITLAYASHPFIDAFNGSVQYFSPFGRYMTFVPKSLRFKVNSSGDHLFFAAGAIGIILFLLLNLQSFYIHDFQFYSPGQL